MDVREIEKAINDDFLPLIADVAKIPDICKSIIDMYKDETDPYKALADYFHKMFTCQFG